jgi:hypothetical protein
MTFTLPERDRNERPWIDSASLGTTVYLDEIKDLIEADLASLQAEAEARARVASRMTQGGEPEAAEELALSELFKSAARAELHRRRTAENWALRVDAAGQNPSNAPLAARIKSLELELQQARESRDRWKLRAAGGASSELITAGDSGDLLQLQQLLKRDPDAIQARSSLLSAATHISKAVARRTGDSLEAKFMVLAAERMPAAEFQALFQTAMSSHAAAAEAAVAEFRADLMQASSLLKVISVGAAITN